ncbi:DUF1116 domain-containing protein [Virgibacillus halodenitrificans]|uniref:DUF1116 domain-containing protein n=1 Tax=Virgibacillus halodenitrificans TaxID=1482 RepID=UPI001FB4F051|nr:DUF1116 domain-containing protein [Virgibacillus halodenitrificans]MCJ0929920.1 DUF1116 domain-containing protein [Virgibacillus halodenitrificans]WHX26401.1 DUF1116 domain-containing protein [Virgibacillus halodenitrificans]
MSTIDELFNQSLHVVNIGTSKFKEDLDRQGVETIQVDWQPPAGGNLELIKALDLLQDNEKVEQANKEAIKRIKDAHPFLIDIDLAVNVIPGMHNKKILHSGPPIAWGNMAGPMQGAIIGAMIFEGMATNEEEARAMIDAGEIEFGPCNEHSAVGPMAGIVSPTMPVHVIENRTHGNKAYCSVNEGLGKVLRFGAFSDEVIDRLKWLRDVFAPALKKALALTDGIDLKSITAQALHMGDECHNRNKASTSLFYREIGDYFLQTDLDTGALREVLRFIQNNEHYFLNLSMPACKSALDAGHGVPYSTVVTTMARNGVEFGIRISGLGEKEWFTAPANFIKGLFFPGYSEDDATRDLGDSAITETMGIGGFAMGGSPAIVQFVGGEVDDAIQYSEQMFDITVSENSNYSIPTLNFRGSAFGIDIRKVIETGILPVINTGMAHKVAGIGQIGAGIVHPPKECFEKALVRFHNVYGEDGGNE